MTGLRIGQMNLDDNAQPRYYLINRDDMGWTALAGCAIAIYFLGLVAFNSPEELRNVLVSKTTTAQKIQLAQLDQTKSIAAILGCVCAITAMVARRRVTPSFLVFIATSACAGLAHGEIFRWNYLAGGACIFGVIAIFGFLMESSGLQFGLRPPGS